MYRKGMSRGDKIGNKYELNVIPELVVQQRLQKLQAVDTYRFSLPSITKREIHGFKAFAVKNHQSGDQFTLTKFKSQWLTVPRNHLNWFFPPA